MPARRRRTRRRPWIHPRWRRRQRRRPNWLDDGRDVRVKGRTRQLQDTSTPQPVLAHRGRSSKARSSTRGRSHGLHSCFTHALQGRHRIAPDFAFVQVRHRASRRRPPDVLVVTTYARFSIGRRTGEVTVLNDDVIVLDGVRKEFGDFVAVERADFAIVRGEFFSLLGPSGCGKTTLLKMIAGFEQPTSGQVMLEGADVSNVPPYQRNVNTVFQQYALFPHMSVLDNVAFGLRAKKVSARRGPSARDGHARGGPPGRARRPSPCATVRRTAAAGRARRAHSSTCRARSCSTNRWRRSTSSSARRCNSSSSASSARSRSRSSSSPTTKARPSR